MFYLNLIFYVKKNQKQSFLLGINFVVIVVVAAAVVLVSLFVLFFVAVAAFVNLCTIYSK